MIRASLLILAFACIFIVGCEDEKKWTACTPGVTACNRGEDCLWVHSERDYRCAHRCSSSDECPEGESCRYGASSSAECDDDLRICL